MSSLRVPPWLRVCVAMFAVGWGANQFASMLTAYRRGLGMSPQTVALLFAVYAVGLIPTLLIGGAVSDRRGRRAVVLPFTALSPIATLLLVVWQQWALGLALARLLAGISSGMVVGAATAWVADLSADAAPGAGARRAAVALTAGFGLGPLVAGLDAAVSAHPLSVPYVPHLALGVLALLLVLPVAGPPPVAAQRRPLWSVPGVVTRRAFVLRVALAAPWVFGSVSISFAYLPSVVRSSAHGALAFAAVLTFTTLAAGVATQPLARRLVEHRERLASQVGLACLIVGLGLGVAAITADSRVLVLVSAPFFGAAYGCGLQSGLRESERLTVDAERGSVIGIFYSLAYLGMFAPYLLGVFASARTALVVATGLALLSLVVASTAGARSEPA